MSMSSSHRPSAVALGARRRSAVLWALCAALVLVVSAVASLNVALPNIASETGATQTELHWLVDSYALVFAALLLPFGALGDRYGRRAALLVGLTIFAGASLVAIFLGDPGALIVVRAVMGIGAALIMPATLSIITNVFPADQRGRAVGVWAGVAGAGGIVGLLVSGALLEGFSWPAVFAVNVVIAAVAIAAALAVVPESRATDPAHAPLDPVGGVLAVVGLGGLIFAIIEGPAEGWGSAPVVASAIAGTIGFAGFVVWELRREHPLLDPRLFRLKGFGTGSLSITLQFFAAFGFFYVVLQFLQSILGYSTLESGLAMLPMGLGLVVLSPRTPALAERVGIRLVGTAGLLAMAGGLVVLSFLDGGSSYWLVVAGLVPLGIGMALCTAPATTAIVSSLPPERQGVASAVNDTAREVGGALGIAVMGSALNETYQADVEAATAALPPEAAARATESLTFAQQASGQLGEGGVTLLATAEQAFVDGFSLSLLVGAGVLVAGAVFVAVRSPGRDEVTVVADLAAREGAQPAGDAQPPVGVAEATT